MKIGKKFNEYLMYDELFDLDRIIIATVGNHSEITRKMGEYNDKLYRITTHSIYDQIQEWHRKSKRSVLYK